MRYLVALAVVLGVLNVALGEPPALKRGVNVREWLAPWTKHSDAEYARLLAVDAPLIARIASVNAVTAVSRSGKFLARFYVDATPAGEGHAERITRALDAQHEQEQRELAAGLDPATEASRCGSVELKES